jgi:hypothetical protein
MPKVDVRVSIQARKSIMTSVRPGGSASHPPQARKFGIPSLSPPLKGDPKIKQASNET